MRCFSCNYRANPIGAYGVTFHKRAMIRYKTIAESKGHFVRKSNWHKMLDNLDPILQKDIKKNFLTDYIENCKNVVKAHKLAY